MAAAEPPSDVLVRPLHVLPGRARLEVAGLRHSPELKARLERALTEFAGTRRIQASTQTGNLLVNFDPATPLERIVTYVAAVVRGGLAAWDEDTAGDKPGLRWYARSSADVAMHLQTSITEGLSTRAARERLTEHGANILPLPVARSGFEILLRQFQSPPVALLGAAAAVSLLTGGLLEVAAILGAVALNGAIGYAVESRSERTITSLAGPVQQTATVVRDGEVNEVALSNLVPGDLIALQRDSIVPADARVVTARNLTVSEAMLTGESVPVAKHGEPLPERSLPLADRKNMVYRGTAVTGGSGTAIVVSTGPATEVGRIQRLLAGTAPPETPMQKQLDAIGRQLVWFGTAVCGALLGIGMLRGFGLYQMFRSSVSLAVAAIPEALPTVATTTLALGIEDMRRRNVLVRKLGAVETLASVRVFCFDKTGTLTLNQMSVAAIDCGRALSVAPDGVIAEPAHASRSAGDDSRLQRLLQIGVLCSETTVEAAADGKPLLDGTATENALIRLAMGHGMDAVAERERLPRISIRQRSDAYRFMMTRHRVAEGRVLVAVKGSPEDVLALCTRRLGVSAETELTDAERGAILRSNLEFAERALRVLGFAFAEVEEQAGASRGEAEIPELTWVGLAGLADPVRPGAPALMRILRQAGIHPVVMTGDQVATARAVARQLALGDKGGIHVLEPADLEGLAPEQLAESAQRVDVFARVSPAEKLRIVRALQASGVVVAMTGDGINDSPAMKAADVGIAMGWSGAEAAREVADVVLKTDDLMAIGVAIERGRATYDNVRKSVRYLLGTNLSEIAVVLAATSAGFAEPLTPIQLLWINLVSDVLPALGLAFDPPEPGLLTRPPRATDAGVLSGADLRTVGLDGGVMAAGALAACGYGVLRYGVSAEARTMTLGSLLVAQLLHALTCRSATRNGPDAGRNTALTTAIGASLAAQGAALLVPGVRRVLGSAPLGLVDLGVTGLAGVLPYLVNERRKPERPPSARTPLAPNVPRRTVGAGREI